MDLSDETRSALLPVMQPAEQVSRSAAAVGCTLILTDRRLYLVRDGVAFRPRTGVQSWDLARSLGVRMTPVRRSTGRVVIEGNGRVASVFVTAAQAAEVETLLAEVRRRIYSTTVVEEAG